MSAAASLAPRGSRATATCTRRRSPSPSSLGRAGAPDSVVHGGVHLLDKTALGRGVTVHAGAWLRDTVVEDGALSAEQRSVFVLRVMEEMSYREIAEALALSPGTVMSRLSRAREKLRVALLPYLGSAERRAGSGEA